MREESLNVVVSHGESSPLKADLNRGVVSLASAPNTYFRPHLCLNGEDGVRVIGEITPSSNTAFRLWHNMIASGGDVWLNIIFVVYLNDFCIPTNCARLSPRQTAYIIANLPAESKVAVLAKAKRWYLKKFLAEMRKGLDTIIMSGMYAKRALNSQILGAILGIWAVVALAFKFGKPGWSKRDKLCLGIGLAGLVLWQLFSNPELGIILGLAGAYIAAWPTFEEAWKHPSHEDKLAWTIFSLACVFALIAIPQWTVAHAAMPVVFAAIDIPVTLIIYFCPWWLESVRAKEART